MALRGYVAKCRARFGVHVLRCDFAAGRATACNARVYRLANPRSRDACGAAVALTLLLLMTCTVPAALGHGQQLTDVSPSGCSAPLCLCPPSGAACTTMSYSRCCMIR